MDNLLDLKRNVDTAIPINGGVASVRTSNHNPLEKNIIDKVGRYTGFPFKTNVSVLNNSVPVGSFFWQGNSMNTQSDFEIVISKKTLDGNAIDEIIRFLKRNDLIHYKDSKGHSVIMRFKSYSSALDSIGNEYLRLSVSSSVNNPAVIFTNDVNYETHCFLEFIPFSADVSTESIYRDYVPVNTQQTSVLVVVDQKNNSFKVNVVENFDKIEGVAEVNYFDGETIKIKNSSSDNSLILRHFSVDVQYPFFFKDGLDYILKPKEVLLFTFDIEEGVFDAHTNYESSLSRTHEVFTVEASMYSSDSNYVNVQLMSIPSESGISVYLQGVLQSPDAYVINENTIIINNNLIPATINHNDIIVVTYTIR